MISIVDYGLGNVRAFVNALNLIGVKTEAVNNASKLNKSSKIILPGVGSFDHAIEKLNSSGMRDTLEQLVINDKIPILGVCVGMQILAESSREGRLSGLGWIKGKVKMLDASKLQAKPKLPHMGWNNISIQRNIDLMLGLNSSSMFYFLHSYYFDCEDNNEVITTTKYGIEFSSSINKENIFGVQFHPEKSHIYGIKLLSNFSKL